MDREERKQRRDERRANIQQHSGSRIGSGFLLLAAGGLLLARQVGADIPGWLLSWPMLLVAIGLLISLKSGFRNSGGLIMILVGVAFLLNDIIPDAHMQDFIWPCILIIAGIVFILRPKQYNKKEWYECENKKRDWSNYGGQLKNQIITESMPAGTSTEDPAEYLEINAVFGGINKLVLSKNFKGGEINSFMGGAEVNLLQSDIKQTVVLEINNVFGGTKLIVPGNWDVKNQITAVFGGVDDKRSASISSVEPGKTIILKGSCVFGGIEIRNF